MFLMAGWVSHRIVRFTTQLTAMIACVSAFAVSAKDLVNQCTLPGQQLSASPTLALSSSIASSGERPDGEIYPTGPEFQNLLPRVQAIDLGRVNPKTGSYTFSHEDISIGQGEFPARLSLTRTYDSLWADAARDQIYSPRFGPGAPEIKPFGVGSTHNLDLRFQSGFKAFGGPAYKMLYFSLGPKSVIFQQCANGEFVNSLADGARITEIASVPFPPDSWIGTSSGYRLDLRDGTIIYFFRAGSGVCSPKYDNVSRVECGWATRWVSPSGEWMNMTYEKYYDHPDGAINSHLQVDNRVDSYDSSQQFCIATNESPNSCKMVDSTYYFFHDSLSGGIELRTNNAIDSYRLTKVENSRNFHLDFTYVDESTHTGGICPTVVGPPSGVHCLPAANTSRQRGLISSVRAFAGSQEIGEATYDYGVVSLNTFTSIDGKVTKYQSPQGDSSESSMKLKIFLPTDHVNPAVSVDFVAGKASFFQHLPVGIYQSGFAPHAYRKYPRAVTQTFADGRVIQYQATTANKWRSSSRMRFGSSAPTTYWTPVEYITRMEVIEAGGVSTVYRFDDEDGPVEVTDPLGRVTENTYDDVGRLLTSVSPEDNSVSLTYDVRGNVTKRVLAGKPGSGVASISESSTLVGGPTLHASDCANQKTCNRPLSATDGRGNVTNYTWDAATGLVTSIKGPTDAGGQRPTTTFGYTAYTAPAGGTVRLLTSKTQSIAAGQSVTTSYGYDPANHLFPKEIVEDVGGLNLRTCVKLDAAGRPISETLPRAGLAACP